MKTTPYKQGFVVGQPVPEGASPHQTETHALPVAVLALGTTTTVAVLVSTVPASLSKPGAPPPSSPMTPNHGSGPITNMLLAGCTTMLAVLPLGSVAKTDVDVEAAPPLIETEHQLW